MILDFLINKLVNEHYPELKDSSCIFLSNIEEQRCNQCQSSCPKGAIQLTSGKVNFNHDRCIRCGICKAVCPTKAIRMKGLVEENILYLVKNTDEVVCSCRKIEDKTGVKLSCLNAMEAELLAALFILYPDKCFYFNGAKCQGCQRNAKEYLFPSSLQQAVEFVETIGVRPHYKLLGHKEASPSPAVQAISRRELFSFIRNESTNMATKAAQTVLRDPNENVSSRSILLDAIAEAQDLKDAIISKVSFFGIWQVSHKCDGCGRCAGVCPAKAWRLEKDKEVLTLSHHGLSCYHCGQCVLSCPKEAITPGTSTLKELRTLQAKRVIPLSLCPKCNHGFIPTDAGENQCPVCKKKEMLRRKIAEI